MGDVKLAGVMGLFLGRAVAPAIFIALSPACSSARVIMARVGVAEGRKQAVPFGPFLALGGLSAFFVGDDVVDAYLDTLLSAARLRRPEPWPNARTLKAQRSGRSTES